MSNKNVRDFDEETLKAGQNIIGLQVILKRFDIIYTHKIIKMGTNQGSSQKGMTPYGLGRQMTMKNKD